MNTSQKCLIKSILIVICGAICAVAGASFVYINMKKRVSREKRLAEKHLDILIFLNDWISFKQRGKSMVNYFEKYNYRSIAIYGMSFVGETLAHELEGSGITVKYGIDRNAREITSDFELVTPDEELERVDVIVVTALSAFDEIEEYLSEKVDYPIVSIEDILYEG